MKNKKILFLIVFILVLLLIPKIDTYKDGGTRTFTAFLYKIIAWHSMTAIESMQTENADEYKTGIEVHFFPNNFNGLDYYKYNVKER